MAASSAPDLRSDALQHWRVCRPSACSSGAGCTPGMVQRRPAACKPTTMSRQHGAEIIDPPAHRRMIANLVGTPRHAASARS